MRQPPVTPGLTRWRRITQTLDLNTASIPDELSITCESNRIPHTPWPSSVLITTLCSRTPFTRGGARRQLQQSSSWPKIQLCSKPCQQQGWERSPDIQGQMPPQGHPSTCRWRKPLVSFLLALLSLGLQLRWEEPECKCSLAVDRAHPLTCCYRVPEKLPSRAKTFPHKTFFTCPVPLLERNSGL